MATKVKDGEAKMSTLKSVLSKYLEENPDKKDFGDVDILYSHKKDNFILIDYIKELYKPIEIVNNGVVLSFSYNYNDNYVQVDFIKCKNLVHSKYYYSYGDVGLIIGQIVNYYGLKFGHDGLFIKLTSKHIGYNDDIADKLELSCDFENICKFFDLDFSLWGNFTSENQIFNWFSKSKYFTKNIFTKKFGNVGIFSYIHPLKRAPRLNVNALSKCA